MIFFQMQIEYPEIEDLSKPRHRFMSSFEQVYSIFELSLIPNRFLMIPVIIIISFVDFISPLVDELHVFFSVVNHILISSFHDAASSTI